MLDFDPEKTPDILTDKKAEAICDMLLHVTIYLRRRCDAFVHRDVLIYHVIGKEKAQEKQPKDLMGYCIEKCK